MGLSSQPHRVEEGKPVSYVMGPCVKTPKSADGRSSVVEHLPIACVKPWVLSPTLQMKNET